MNRQSDYGQIEYVMVTTSDTGDAHAVFARGPAGKRTTRSYGPLSRERVELVSQVTTRHDGEYAPHIYGRVGWCWRPTHVREFHSYWRSESYCYHRCRFACSCGWCDPNLHDSRREALEAWRAHTQGR